MLIKFVNITHSLQTVDRKQLAELFLHYHLKVRQRESLPPTQSPSVENGHGKQLSSLLHQRPSKNDALRCDSPHCRHPPGGLCHRRIGRSTGLPRWLVHSLWANFNCYPTIYSNCLSFFFSPCFLIAPPFPGNSMDSSPVSSSSKEEEAVPSSLVKRSAPASSSSAYGHSIMVILYFIFSEKMYKE